MKALLAALLCAASIPALALDRVHFRGMSERDLRYVLTAFQQVRVHYLVTAEGGSIFTSNFAVFLYANPKDATRAKARYDQTNPDKAQLRSAPAARIMRMQFDRRDAAPSQGAHEPDFVIVLDKISFLVQPSGEPVAITTRDKDVVYAYLDPARTTPVQKGLETKGLSTERVSLNPAAFLRFIADQADRQRFVFVHGY